MFTRNTLRRLANSTSFQRCKSFYATGSVARLHPEADEFLASVRGK